MIPTDLNRPPRHASVTNGRSAMTWNIRSPENIKAQKNSEEFQRSHEMPVFGWKLFILAVSAVGFTSAGHPAEKEKSTVPSTHGYGPAIHISSGVLQLAPDTEPTPLLLLSNPYSSSSGSLGGSPWPHLYVETFGASHLPVATSGVALQEPRILVSDNVDFSQLKLRQHTFPVQSHGR
ncbi:uncharacterized protein Dana_GF22325 [Drosophila ananassae]|uniref:Uncharacterized protein n=1 Tax=Drosophila ananassae TaxID=7217 RepID=B3MW50_DROAN|nr:uncharacterized protein LOC6504989 [Drosophila ananassae]EDV35195.2 uncharacterized protein Dana_GF22325 [Drosophila ananassae]